MFLEINNPNPVPVWDVVANFVNSLGYIRGSIPSPVSVMLTTVLVIAASLLSELHLLPDVILIVIAPSFVNLIALINKLLMTRAILSLSAYTKMPSS